MVRTATVVKAGMGSEREAIWMGDIPTDRSTGNTGGIGERTRVGAPGRVRYGMRGAAGHCS